MALSMIHISNIRTAIRIKRYGYLVQTKRVG